MKRLFLFISLLITTIGIQANREKNPSLDKLYHTLDSLIERQPDIIAEKEAHIRGIITGLQGVKLTPEQEIELNLRMYDEYLAFKFDSAFSYINKNIQHLRLSDNKELFAASAVRMTHILSVCGLFDRAQKHLNEISPRQLSVEGRVQYYNQQCELNLYRSEMAQYSSYFMEYIDSVQYYRQLLMQIAPKESFEYKNCLAAYTCEKGDVKQAIEMFEEYLPTLRQGDRQYSIVASTLAYFYGRDHQVKQQERCLLLSAISDIRGAILENNALRELSGLLLERGEVKRAYNYLSRASNDARLYGSRLRSMQVAQLSPLITKAYDTERTQAERRTRLLLIIISVIALLLVGTMAYTLSQIRKRRLATEQIRNMNSKLSQQNREMQVINAQMREANLIKEEYIGRFLELCSTLVHRGEERLKHFNRLARERKLETLYAELKNNSSINEGIRLFHQNFDTAFLNIYPNFIPEVNRLMVEDNTFEVNEDSKRLTTELRVLALIRLGITDNQKIADILRSSITTIYTYRSKLKARSKSKETFEEDIRGIVNY